MQFPIVRSWKILKGALWLRIVGEMTGAVTKSLFLFLSSRSIYSNRVYLFSCVITIAWMCKTAYVPIDRLESPSATLSMSVTLGCPRNLQSLPISFMAPPLVIPGLEASIGPICSLTNTGIASVSASNLDEKLCNLRVHPETLLSFSLNSGFSFPLHRPHTCSDGLMDLL